MASAIAVRTIGSGPPLLLVHGGVGPGLTWEMQEPLAERWRLVIPSRRGFGDSPPVDRQDFDNDAADLEALLDVKPMHAVGFSYGGVGLSIAAGRDPARVKSLTLIEVPLFAVAPDDPDLDRVIRLAASYSRGDQAAATEFEGIAEMAGSDDPRFGGEMAEARRMAQGFRMPDEAEPDLAAINAAGVPAMVVSGGHPGMEALCDEIARRLAARRACLDGAGHALQRTPPFNALLEDFLRRAEGAR